MRPNLVLMMLMVVTVSAHLAPYQWMKKNKVNEDFMHMNAMKAQREAHKANVLLHDYGYVSSMGLRTYQQKEFGEYLTEYIPRSQMFFAGFVNGTNSLNDASTC